MHYDDCTASQVVTDGQAAFGNDTAVLVVVADWSVVLTPQKIQQLVEHWQRRPICCHRWNHSREALAVAILTSISDYSMKRGNLSFL